MEFLTKIELEDDAFLDTLTTQNKIRILGAFAQAVREREFSIKGENDLVASTCREAVDKVAEVHRTYHRRDPRYGEHDTDTNEQLKLLYRGYNKSDPAIKQQKALTPSFFKFMFRNAITQRQKAISLLCIAAFFWACRSCEYSTVHGERHTKICKIRNIRFFNGNKELKHSDPHLANADRVT